MKGDHPDNPMATGYGFKDELTYLPPVAFACDICDEPVYEGDLYLRIFTLRICEACVNSRREPARREEECMSRE